MTDDIVARLRAVFHNDRSVEMMNRDAADEIERLRNELDGSQLAYRGASYDRDRMRAERDDARLRLCKVLGDIRDVWGDEIAIEKGWRFDE